MNWFGGKNTSSGDTSGRRFFDYASVTPVSPRVARAMEESRGAFFNPAALYAEGKRVSTLMSDAKARIARRCNCRQADIIVTSGGTESVNLALRGTVEAARKDIPRPHIVISSFEHSSVLETVSWLEGQGVLVTQVQPDEQGIVHAEDIAAALTQDTVLVSIMLVNNEIGTIAPMRDISKVIKKARRTYGRNEHWSYPYLHTDASQAPLYLDCHMTELGVDMMTLDGIKMYGPRGAGLLIAKKELSLAPIMFGGSQQRGVRPGTENLELIVGLAEALDEAAELREKEVARLGELQKYFIERMLALNATQNGQNGPREIISLNGVYKKWEHIVNNVNFCLPHFNGEFFALQLDAKGFAVSTASTCRNLEDAAGSYVIEQLGDRGQRCKESSIRVTFGRETTREDVEALADAIESLIGRGHTGSMKTI